MDRDRDREHASAFRRWKYASKYIEDPRTGFSRSEGDIGRSDLYGPHIHTRPSPKCTNITLKSRCRRDCPICRGEEPGCRGGSVTVGKLRRYQESVANAELKLTRDNDEYMRKIGFFRALACLYYLRTFTFSFRNLSQVFFSLYNQSLTVERNPNYPVKWVAFQNRLDSLPFLTWKTEPRCVVFSQRQKNSLICLGGSTRFLAMLLVFATQRCGYLRSHILIRLFRKKSIHRLVRAGGLNPSVFTYQCRSESYFGN